jgi:hypothetical protein
MNVQEVIDKLMLVKDKSKHLQVTITRCGRSWCSTNDIDDIIEEDTVVEATGGETDQGGLRYF